jgi:hypothetical protein
MRESKLASTDRPMKVYESGLALLDTEIRTEVTLNARLGPPTWP